MCVLGGGYLVSFFAMSSIMLVNLCAIANNLSSSLVSSLSSFLSGFPILSDAACNHLICMKELILLNTFGYAHSFLLI